MSIFCPDCPSSFPEQPRLCVIVCSVFQVASGGESSCLGSQALQGVSLKRAEVWVITELIEPLFWAAPFFSFSGRHLRGLFVAEGAAAAKLMERILIGLGSGPS